MQVATRFGKTSDTTCREIRNFLFWQYGNWHIVLLTMFIDETSMLSSVSVFEYRMWEKDNGKDWLDTVFIQRMEDWASNVWLSKAHQKKQKPPCLSKRVCTITLLPWVTPVWSHEGSSLRVCDGDGMHSKHAWTKSTQLNSIPRKSFGKQLPDEVMFTYSVSLKSVPTGSLP